MESLKAPTMKKRDDELALFQEMRKIEKEHIGLRLLENSEELDTHGHANPPPLGSKEGSSPIFNISAAAPTRKTGGDDFLNCDVEKNDYDCMTSLPSTSSMNIRDLLDKSQLIGLNFKSWYRNLRLVLECENLLYIIDQPAPAPPASHESAKIKVAYSRYFVDRTTVRCIILASMTEELRRQYDEDLPDVMIKKLSESYGTFDKIEKFNLTRILFNEKMREGESVGEHSRRLISISERLAAFGMVIPKDLVQNIILYSLPPSFKDFITIFNMMDLNYTHDRLVELLIEYQRKNGLLKTSTPMVNVVTNVLGSSSSSKRKRYSKKKKKNKSTPKEKGKEKIVGPPKKIKANKSKAQCFHCSGIGHWKRNCPTYLNEIKRKKTSITG